MSVPDRPPIAADDASRIARTSFALDARATELPSYEGRNFRLDTSRGECWVLKIAAPGVPRGRLELENATMRAVAARLGDDRVPSPHPATDGEEVVEIELAGGTYFCRLLRWIEGRRLRTNRPSDRAKLERFGAFIGQISGSLDGFDHPAAHERSIWDLRSVLGHTRAIAAIEDPDERLLVDRSLCQLRARMPESDPALRLSVVHNDANDDNVLIMKDGRSAIIDFGDVTFSYTVSDLVIALAYVLQELDEPCEAAASVIRGYHRVFALEVAEVDALSHLIMARLVTSLLASAERCRIEPENEYLGISRRPARRLLKKLERIGSARASDLWRRACSLELRPRTGRSIDELLAARKKHLGPSLSLSYRRPLLVERAQRQFLIDHRGDAYLDLVNNVCHVGHCHPQVVTAAQRQLGELNTNTRYLYDGLTDYAERLTSLLPEPLEVCYFVCSGSEANELALRMARAHTGRRDVLVLDAAYHGKQLGVDRHQPLQIRRPRRRRRSATRHGRRPSRLLQRPPPRRSRQDRPGLCRRRRVADRAACAGRTATGSVHRRVDARLWWSARAPGRLSRGCLPRDSRARRSLHRRRSPSRLRPSRLALLGLRHPGRRSRHRHARQADRQRTSARRGRYHA